MSREDSILNVAAYVVVFIVGVIAGGLSGLYVGFRLSYDYPALILACGAIGALLGGVASIVFALTHKHGKSTLREVHERMDRRRR